jgi:hypothetical protein
VSWLFPLPGIVGIDHINLGQGAGSAMTLSQCAAAIDNPSLLGSGSMVAGSLGTNNLASTNLTCYLGSRSDAVYGNSARMYMGRGAPTTSGNAPNPNMIGAQPGGVVWLESKLELPPLDSIFQTGEDGATDSSLAAGNSNLTGMTFSGCSNPYDAATRKLTLNSNCTVTLQGSTDVDHPRVYNFCQVGFPSNGAVVQLPSTATGSYARVLIDSPARSGSGCPSGTGSIAATNGVANNGNSMLANASNAIGAQIFVYGTTDAAGQGGNLIKWQNAGSARTLLVAPKATIQFQNRTTITGGLAAYGVDAQNGLVYIWDQNVDRVERRALYYRSADAECSRAPSIAGDPHSGC